MNDIVECSSNQQLNISVVGTGRELVISAEAIVEQCDYPFLSIAKSMRKQLSKEIHSLQCGVDRLPQPTHKWTTEEFLEYISLISRAIESVNRVNIEIDENRLGADIF